MFRVSQKWHLQTFLGRKQISATTTAFPGHKHLWNMVQDYFSEQKTPATAMSAPSGSRHEWEMCLKMEICPMVAC